MNLASRLEGVNKLFKTDILISESTKAMIGDAFATREIGEIAVFGRTGGVRIFELLDGPAGSGKASWVTLYEEALGAYRGRRFGAALERLTQVLGERPSDAAARWLQAECTRLAASPPDETWDGVITLGTK